MSSTAHDYLTIPEAAEMLRVSVSTVRRWIRDGTIQAHRAGHRRLLLKREDVTETMRAVEPAPVAITRVTHHPAEALAAHDKARQEASGIMSPESWEDIREAREFRTEQLSGEDDSEFDQFDIGVLAHMIVHSPDRPRRRRLTADEQRRWFVALERAQRTSDRIQQRSGVDTFPPSEDIIAETREERVRQLTGDNDESEELDS